MQAGGISSLPYVIASFATPVLGTILYKLGDGYYDSLCKRK